PKVPLHVRVTQPGIPEALLRVDEIGGLDTIAHEEGRSVVADHVEITFGRVETQGESAHVPPGVRRALFTGHCGEASEHLSFYSGLQEGRAGVLRHVLGYLELTEGSATLGV